MRTLGVRPSISGFHATWPGATTSPRRSPDLLSLHSRRTSSSGERIGCVTRTGSNAGVLPSVGSAGSGPQLLLPVPKPRRRKSMLRRECLRALVAQPERKHMLCRLCAEPTRRRARRLRQRRSPSSVVRSRRRSSDGYDATAQTEAYEQTAAGGSWVSRAPAAITARLF